MWISHIHNLQLFRHTYQPNFEARSPHEAREATHPLPRRLGFGLVRAGSHAERAPQALRDVITSNYSDPNKRYFAVMQADYWGAELEEHVPPNWLVFSASCQGHVALPLATQYHPAPPPTLRAAAARGEARPFRFLASFVGRDTDPVGPPPDHRRCAFVSSTTACCAGLTRGPAEGAAAPPRALCRRPGLPGRDRQLHDRRFEPAALPGRDRRLGLCARPARQRRFLVPHLRGTPRPFPAPPPALSSCGSSSETSPAPRLSSSETPRKRGWLVGVVC